ncbi:beta-galactosidase 13-like isoform X1 [Tripterygium wilfordii]|uniref:beta-galactosidase 13-like isoform X1 n=2 Tax=Tripterygium wilfordii TaxID=458696 RepID=UPI0018F81FC7|nr:beta-galactosidase 13-like isoform X1 [Tripterygium wilfordii]
MPKKLMKKSIPAMEGIVEILLQVPISLTSLPCGLRTGQLSTERLETHHLKDQQKILPTQWLVSSQGTELWPTITCTMEAQTLVGHLLTSQLLDTMMRLLLMNMVCKGNLNGANICAAFLVNNNTKIPQTVNFKGKNYIIPPRSISILPDCKTVVYNTETIVAQHNSRNFMRSEIANWNIKWKMYKEVIPSQFSLKSIRPYELFGLTKDTTDYAWYSTSIELDRADLAVRKDIAPVIRIPSLGHAMIVFVNGEYLGSAHGNHDVKGFVFQNEITLKPGVNQITLLCSTMGFPDSGPYMERVYTGPRALQLLGLNTGNLDLTFNGWGHQVGLDGEKLGLFSEGGSQKVEWTKANGVGPPLTWYKARFDAPEGKNPVVIQMTGMGKGMVWVNGNSIGRHWMSFLSALGQPSQSEYHIPRAYVKPKDNLLVIFEEEAVDPKAIEILVVDRDTICSFMTELHPPHVKSWARQNSHMRPVVDIVRPAAHLKCPNHKTILAVEFASWGDPYGACGNYFVGNCSSPISKEVVEKRCLGETECEIPIERKLLDMNNDGCPDITKTLAVQAKCGFNEN